jgi:hypothetical protein
MTRSFERESRSARVNSAAPRVGASAAMLLAFLVFAVSCAEAQKYSCRVTGESVALPDLPEASGLTASHRTPGQLWSHNDSGEPTLFALTTAGAVQGRVRVTGAQVGDWESISVGPCPQGTCVYIGDIGDNNAKRRDITIYRVPEPEPGAKATADLQSLRATYPDGPQDAEALFVMPNGAVFVVTKGEKGPVALYRVPAHFGKDAQVQLERIATVIQNDKKQKQGVAPRLKVTGASASPDGRWIALRTLDAITFYVASEFLVGKIREVLRYDLSQARERQGEGVTFAEDGAIWLASEGGGKSRPGTLARLDCTLP